MSVRRRVHQSACLAPQMEVEVEAKTKQVFGYLENEHIYFSEIETSSFGLAFWLLKQGIQYVSHHKAEHPTKSTGCESCELRGWGGGCCEFGSKIGRECQLRKVAWGKRDSYWICCQKTTWLTEQKHNSKSSTQCWATGMLMSHPTGLLHCRDFGRAMRSWAGILTHRTIL